MKFRTMSALGLVCAASILSAPALAGSFRVRHVASSDEQAVGLPGGVTYFRIQRPLAVNGLGSCAFACAPSDPSLPAGIFAEDEQGLHLLISSGDALPGPTVRIMRGSPMGLTFNDLGQVLTLVQFESPSGGSAALVALGGNAPSLVLASGDAAPGMPGHVVSYPAREFDFALNDAGEVLTWASFENGDDGVGVLLAGMPGNLAPVFSTEAPPAPYTPGDGVRIAWSSGPTRRAMALNDSGELVAAISSATSPYAGVVAGTPGNLRLLAGAGVALPEIGVPERLDVFDVGIANNGRVFFSCLAQAGGESRSFLLSDAGDGLEVVMEPGDHAVGAPHASISTGAIPFSVDAVGSRLAFFNGSVFDPDWGALVYGKNQLRTVGFGGAPVPLMPGFAFALPTFGVIGSDTRVDMTSLVTEDGCSYSPWLVREKANPINAALGLFGSLGSGVPQKIVGYGDTLDVGGEPKTVYGMSFGRREFMLGGGSYELFPEARGGVPLLMKFDDGTEGLFVVTCARRGKTDGAPGRRSIDLPGLLRGFGTERGATPADGDLDGDGDVDLGDVREFIDGFGGR